MFSTTVDSLRIHIRSNLFLRRFSGVIVLARPHQWVKNGFVLAPILFSGNMTDFHLLLIALQAFFCFCLISSAVYIMNDIGDVSEDRKHPRKRNRPIASGIVPIGLGVVIAVVLMSASIFWSFSLSRWLGAIISIYLIVNVLYTFKLKRVVILDVFSIGIGFILRVLGGALVISVMPSHWILICTGLLSLFLGFSKRRSELVRSDDAASHRSVLSEYNTYYLDQMLLIVAGTTIIAYLLYTISPDTIARVGDKRLLITLPFVLYGLFRYQYLIYHRGDNGDPTKNLLTDKPILIDVALWAATVFGAIYYPW